MGKFEGKFFAGPVGPVIFRKSKGKQIVSVKPLPGTVKQTENTKKASGTFGMASLMTSQIREGFSHEISNLHDGSLHSRLMITLNPILSQCRIWKRLNMILKQIALISFKVWNLT